MAALSAHASAVATGPNLATAGLRLFSSDARAAPAPGDRPVQVLAPMNLEIVPAQPVRGRRFLRDEAKGAVGHCEVPSCVIRSTLPPRSAPRDADLCIWLIEEGQLGIDQHDGTRATFGAGSVLLCDLSQPLHGHWEQAQARFGYIHPSRQSLTDMLGFAPGPRPHAVAPLEHLGLAPFLGSHLGMLAAHGASLTPPDLETVLAGIFRIAETLLRSAFAVPPQRGGATGGDRLEAVRRHIQRNLHRHDLSVADIALGASISRAQLYRLFASQDRSVHATLREERLAKSMSYLTQPANGRLSIGAIAYACGFSDQAVFSKLFRQRFDMTPREVRACACAATPP